jgi:N-acetylmuramoyl-L-alanine amidase
VRVGSSRRMASRPLFPLVAILVLASPLASAAPAVVGGAATADAPRAARAAQPDATRPPVTWKRIPFGEARKREMGAYSNRHYGVWGWRLREPHVIVEHYTGGTSFSAAWNTFASNSRHLGELPGTCAHFIVDTDGRIYQLVPSWIRCRHTMGLNDTAFGIEHVGTSDQALMGNAKQIASSYRLTLWLMQRFHIELRNVIGHNESLISPYHHELVARFRCQTHSDFTHADMHVYRRHLKALAKAHHVPIGPPPAWVDSNC